MVGVALGEPTRPAMTAFAHWPAVQARLARSAGDKEADALRKDVAVLVQCEGQGSKSASKARLVVVEEVALTSDGAPRVRAAGAEVLGDEKSSPGPRRVFDTRLTKSAAWSAGPLTVIRRPSNLISNSMVSGSLLGTLMQVPG